MENLNVNRMVDIEPNKKGIYTVLKVGISFLHGEESKFCKILDKSNKREYWTELPNWLDATNNEYTNIGIHSESLVFPENIEIENVTLQHKVYEECIREIDELVHSYLKDFGILYREDGDIQLFVKRRYRYYGNEEYTKKCNEFNERIGSLKEKYNLLNLYRDFDSVLADAVSEMEGEKDNFADDFELELCPICKTNYIQADEIMCASCLKERQENGEIFEDDDEWDAYANREDNDDYVSDEEETGDMASISEIDDDVLGNDLVDDDLGFDLDLDADDMEDIDDDEEMEDIDDDFEDIDLDDDFDDDDFEDPKPKKSKK